MIPRYSRQEMASIWSDESRYGRWLEIEILACEARAEAGLMPLDAARRIRENAQFDISKIEEVEERTRHDVIAFVSVVGESIGEDACYFHEGLTSSDILDTALATQLVDAGRLITRDLVDLLKVTADLAWRHRNTPIVARTHGVHAEPTTFGLKIGVWHSDIRRCIRRIEGAIDEVRVGKLSGAVGNFAHLPPEIELRVCDRLELNPEPIATQIVQRDRHAAFLSALALVASVAEKIATEIRHLQKTEILEVEEPFGKGQRGSSAMPHKKNPILCENICGLARLVKSYVVPALENVALWHERDISHSSVERIILPDATIGLDFLLNRLLRVLTGLVVHPERMRTNLDLLQGLVFSQRVLLALTQKGISRDQAYEIVQRNALRTWKETSSFAENLLADVDIAGRFSESEVRGWFDPAPYMKHVEYLLDRVGIRAPVQEKP